VWVRTYAAWRMLKMDVPEEDSPSESLGPRNSNTISKLGHLQALIINTGAQIKTRKIEVKVVVIKENWILHSKTERED
jgi:hypothetical protein